MPPSASHRHGTGRHPARIGAHLVGRVRHGRVQHGVAAGRAQVQVLRQRADELLGADAGGDLVERHVDAEAAVDIQLRIAPRSASRADARRVAALGCSTRPARRPPRRAAGRTACRSTGRRCHRRGRRTGLGQPVEAVVGVRRGDEAVSGRHAGSLWHCERASLRRVTTNSASRPAEASARRARTRTPSSSCDGGHDLALAVDGGEHVAAVVRDEQLDHVGQRPQPIGQRGAGSRRCPRRCGADRHRARVARPELLGRVGREVGLVEHEQLGHLVGVDLGQHRAHGVDLPSGSAADASTTWTRKSASLATSSVPLNASTRPWGRRRTKPTVSVSSTGSPPGNDSRRVVGSSVANSRSSTSTPAWVSRLSSVDLPAFV